jgi:hypothetical protein
MKKTLFILLTLLFVGISAIDAQQENNQISDTIPAIGYSFPLGVKLKLKLIRPESDTTSYKYTIIDKEEFRDTLIVGDVKKYFSEKPEKDIIEVFFSIGYYTKPQKGVENNKMQTIMTLRNNTEKSLNYIADIVPYGKQEFENTSVTPLLPNVVNIEIWPYFIPVIALYDFKNQNTNIKITNSPL